MKQGTVNDPWHNVEKGKCLATTGCSPGPSLGHGSRSPKIAMPSTCVRAIATGSLAPIGSPQASSFASLTNMHAWISMGMVDLYTHDSQWGSACCGKRTRPLPAESARCPDAPPLPRTFPPPPQPPGMRTAAGSWASRYGGRPVAAPHGGTCLRGTPRRGRRTECARCRMNGTPPQLMSRSKCLHHNRPMSLLGAVQPVAETWMQPRCACMDLEWEPVLGGHP